MALPPLVHVITPGDHYSPRTGSAVPTVVDGLSRSRRPDAPRSQVVVARGTYADRYDSADIVEYDPRPARRYDRYLDAALSRAGAPRLAARRVLAPTLGAQHRLPPSVVLAHNAPALVPLVDDNHHRPVLYAHNHVLRTYSAREARRVLGSAELVVCVSDFLADQVRSDLPTDLRARVVTVRNGVDLAQFALPRPPRGGPLRVAYVGRVIPDKGVHVLLDAVASLRRRDLELTVVGRPGFAADAPLTEYERGLRRRAAETVSPVRFTSFVPRAGLAAILARTDVVVVPSIWDEPFGLTALEGMAAGAAVVASSAGGLPEAVGDAGFLVAPGDRDGLSVILAALADDEAALTAAASRAREHVGRCTWELRASELDRALAVGAT